MQKYFQKGHDRPLTYPLRLSEVGQTNMVNPSDGHRWNVPEPNYPGDEEYEEELLKSVQLALCVARDEWPDWYLEWAGVDPRLSDVFLGIGLSEDDPKGCANAVRMDQPAELWAALSAYAVREGIPTQFENEQGVQFLERFVYPAQLFHDVLSSAMKATFQVKYYYGVARLEECMNNPKMSQYEEGCPNHPSFPAGHATVAGVAYYTFTKIYPKATKEQLHQAYTATRQFAHFRDFAGVHTYQDSYVGWVFGYEFASNFPCEIKCAVK